jgi:sugar-specific transcriptional regulator TrmB
MTSEELAQAIPSTYDILQSLNDEGFSEWLAVDLYFLEYLDKIECYSLLLKELETLERFEWCIQTKNKINKLIQETKLKQDDCSKF